MPTAAILGFNDAYASVIGGFGRLNLIVSKSAPSRNSRNHLIGCD